MNTENNTLQKLVDFFSFTSPQVIRPYHKHIKSDPGVRLEIARALQNYHNDPEKSNKTLSCFGIVHINNDPIIEKFGKETLDSQDFVFRTIGLSEYESSRKKGTHMERILREDFPNLTLTIYPEPNDVVAYMDKDKQFTSYGIVSKVEVDRPIRVISQFCNSKVYDHQINNVPPSHGDDVIFMRKREPTSVPKSTNWIEYILL